MKKAITILMAAALVLGFAGMSAAQECTTCLDPLSINRGCETDQDNCYPFDYENECWEDNYCTVPPGKQNPRVLFPICDCDFAADLSTDDIVDVRLEILVNGKTGNNGAYWAQDPNGYDDPSATGAWGGPRYDLNGDCRDGCNAGAIGMETYASETAACQDSCFGSAFVGDFDLLGYDSSGELVNMEPYERPSCDIPDNMRPTVIQPDVTQDGETHGYQIQLSDEIGSNSVWAIDIPFIQFDPAIINEGDVISVSICLTYTTEDDDWQVKAGSICGTCGCCCEFELGTILCCEAGSAQKLIYPYTTPMNDANWWYGMVITNLSSTAGEAQVTIYETDGDTETITVDVDANSMFVASNVDLMDAFGEDIGDARAYFSVSTDFSADGFLFIGNDGKSEAMGYLPRIPYVMTAPVNGNHVEP